MTTATLEHYLPGPQWCRLRIELYRKARKCGNTHGPGNQSSGNDTAKEKKTQ